MHRGAAGDAADVWHIVVGGRTVGPMRPELVIDQLQRGALGDRPVVWRSGFDQWRALADVPAFARVAQARQAQPEFTASVEDLEFEPSCAVPQPVPLADTVQLSTHVELPEEPASSPTGVAAPTRAVRRVSHRIQPEPEESVMFSLAALRDETPPPAPPRVVDVPAFSSAALAHVEVPAPPPPVMITPPPTGVAPEIGVPPRPIGLYAMMFVLMASIGFVAGLAVLRGTEPQVPGRSADAQRHAAAMSRPDASWDAAHVAAEEPEPDERRHRRTSMPGAPPREASLTVDAPPGEASPRAGVPPGEEPPRANASGHGSSPIDCGLDPSACELPIPEKPTIAQLRASLAAVRAEAKRCGPAHGAPAGAKVEVRLSISGKRGEVISAIPTAPHEDDNLGRCVAAALRTAAFPTFRRPSLGLIYAVRL